MFVQYKNEIMYTNDRFIIKQSCPWDENQGYFEGVAHFFSNL